MLAVEFRSIMTNVHAAGEHDYDIRRHRFQQLLEENFHQDGGLRLARDANSGQDCLFWSDLFFQTAELRRRDEVFGTEMYSVVTYTAIVDSNDEEEVRSQVSMFPLGVEFPQTRFRFVEMPGAQ